MDLENLKRKIKNYCDLTESCVKTNVARDKRVLDKALIAYRKSKKAQPESEADKENEKLLPFVYSELEKVGAGVKEFGMLSLDIEEEYKERARKKSVKVTFEMDRIRSYAILTAMHDNGYELTNCLEPAVLLFVPEHDFVDVSTIKHNLEKTVDMPELMVSKILDQARIKGHVDFDEENELYRLKTETTQTLIEHREDADKRIRELTQNISAYFINHGVIPNMPVDQMIEAFIDKSGLVLDFLQPSRVVPPPSIQTEDVHLKLLIQFFQNYTTKPADVETFKQIVMGSIIFKAILWSGLSSANSGAFNKCELFLDTNFVFSLLGLHKRRINKPVLEMHRIMMSRFDFSLRIFDFTLEQMKKVICSYSPKDVVCMPGALLPSIYNTFQSRRWGREHAKKYADQLPKELEKIGINIYDTGSVLGERQKQIDIDITDFINSYKELFIQYKPMITEHGMWHDLAAISTIRGMRGGIVRDLRNTKAFFLTSDRKLTSFCESVMGHRARDSISEVVLDESFATMLWFLQEDPRVRFTLDTIVAAHSRNLFANTNIWERFTDVLQQMANKNRIVAMEMPNIFYRNIQSVLTEFSDPELDEIDEHFILNRVADAKVQARARSGALDGKMRSLREPILATELQEPKTPQKVKIEFALCSAKKFRVYFGWKNKLILAITMLAILFIITAVVVVLVYLLAD